MTENDPLVSIALFGAELLSRQCPDLAAGQLCTALEGALCRAAHASLDDAKKLHQDLTLLCKDFLEKEQRDD